MGSEPLSLEQLRAVLGILLALGAISYSLVRFVRRGRYLGTTSILFACLSCVVFGAYWAYKHYRSHHSDTPAATVANDRETEPFARRKADAVQRIRHSPSERRPRLIQAKSERGKPGQRPVRTANQAGLIQVTTER